MNLIRAIRKEAWPNRLISYSQDFIPKDVAETFGEDGFFVSKSEVGEVKILETIKIECSCFPSVINGFILNSLVDRIATYTREVTREDYVEYE